MNGGCHPSAGRSGPAPLADESAAYRIREHWAISRRRLTMRSEIAGQPLRPHLGDREDQGGLREVQEAAEEALPVHGFIPFSDYKLFL